MKQVKHYNGFIYYTKYKSSWATLNTKKFFNFWFIKIIRFGHY